MTNLEITSRILNVLKANSKDSRISRRLVLSTAENKAKFFISQKFNDMSLYREANIYRELRCVEMIEIDYVKCPIIEFRMCSSIMRSKKKLPELIWHRYGHSIKEVTSLDGNILIKPSTLAQYRQNKQRSLQRKENNFYIKDGYLYIPDSSVKAVNIYLLVQDLYDLEECSECGEGKCESAWEKEFVCPDKILETVVQESIRELSTAKQIQEDVNPNLNPNG